MMRQCDCFECDVLQGKWPTVNGESSQESQLGHGSDTHPRPAAVTKLRVLSVGLLLSGGFSFVEWGAGRWSHSLSLMTDAGHMLLDCLALLLALAATGLAHFAIRHRSTWGSHRAENFAALANGIGLIVLAGWVFLEATDRFQHNHPAVLSEVMIVTAVIGLGVNIMAASILHGHSHHDLNVRGAFLHILADTVSSLGVLVSAVLIWAFHWNWADQLISMFISAVIAAGAFPLIYASVQALTAPILVGDRDAPQR
jgi:cobalt-zinc-cadmium efflux system protein